MTISLTSPITGAAQTGLTSPTYTIVLDTAPDSNGKQWAVSALGGTQSGVTTHTVSSPFTVTVVKPKSFKQLGSVNPVTGQLASVPKNQWIVLVRKGVLPLAGQPYSVMPMKLTMDVPAGADTADAPNVRAGISAMIGALNQISAGFGDSAVTGTF